MLNIKFEINEFILKFLLNILLLTLILILTFIFNSKVVLSKGLNTNTAYPSSSEKLAIKYCDSINKKIFNGLEKEALLKYEYYFSFLKEKSITDKESFFKEFQINVKKNCSYKLNDAEKQEILNYIKQFINKIND